MRPVLLLVALCACLAAPAFAQTEGLSADAYRARAADAERRGDGRTALDTLTAARKAYPDNADIQREAEKAVTDGLPLTIHSAGLTGLPVDTVSLPDGLGLSVVPKPYVLNGFKEPQHGAAFAKARYIYIPSGEADGSLRLLCWLHYTASTDDTLAARMGGLLALAHRTFKARTGLDGANGETPFHVWLNRDGAAGGEQWRDNLYFTDLDTPRSSIEWIREIAHEYSHLALPPVGGYTSPEYWANGYLGERLIVRWIERTPNGPALVEKVWGDFSGAGNFNRLLIAPALALYHKIGPNAKWLARKDDAGMRYFIGQALTLDDKYGGHALGETFRILPRFRETRAADVMAAFQQYHANSTRSRQN